MRDRGSAWITLPARGLLLTLAVMCSLWKPPPAAAEEMSVVGLRTYPLRDTPDFAAPAVERLPVGIDIEVLENQKGWVKIRAGDKTGWVSRTIVGRTSELKTPGVGLSKKVTELEGRLASLADERDGLKESNRKLTVEVQARKGQPRYGGGGWLTALDYERLGWAALGGGLVVFGWISGYALGSFNRRRPTRHKYRID